MTVPQICVKCQQTLRHGTVRMECPACGAVWPVDQSVASYATATYHGELPQDTMQQLLALAEAGHWLAAARTMFKESDPELYDYVADLNRASWIPMLPVAPQSTVLDVSSGLGALTHALALTYHHVVSVEPVAEMARFTRLRLDQEGLTNVDVIHATLDVLPFSNDTFDVIVLNGVLEWVREWRSSRTCREAQSGVLRVLRRLLKPHGVLIIGSENRIGYTLYRTWKKPGFYRSLVDPAKGHGTHTHTPYGYLKLLRQAGFPSVDLWWPPNGYNSPHTMLRASNRPAVRAYCDSERRYKDRLHGYAFARQLRHVAVVGTRLIHVMLPDVIMIATPTSKREGRPHGGGSLVAAVEEHLSAASRSSGETAGSGSQEYFVDSLTTHPYKNKSVLKVVSPHREAVAVVKVANVRLPGVEVLQRSYQKVQRLCSSFEGSDRFLAGSIPSPMGVVQVGSLLATIEGSARGPRLIDLILDRQYFDSHDRVRRHLERITSWLIASRPALDALGSDSLFGAIPSEWLVGPDGADGAVPAPFRGVQHGDFYPENVFIDDEAQHICVVDWDGCATGYPPLFDWFCLVTGLYYTHERVSSLPRGQTVEFLSFRQTYFETSWFSELIVSLSHQLCDGLGLDRARLRDYFLLYIVVRYRQFLSQSELEEKHYWGPRNRHLYKQYHELLLSNEKACCFPKSTASG